METKEHHCYGGPGAGKTRWLQRQARLAVEAGVDPGEMLFCSYTRAAAATLRGRDLPIRHERQIGTLHSLCYHALDRPKIADTYATKSKDDHIPSWNEWISRTRPDWRLSDGGSMSVDEQTGERFAGRDSGDRLHATMERMRAMMRPRELWPVDVAGFAARWDEWCQNYNLVSFTGMIETALERIDVAPGDPTVGFFDEAQDFSLLQISLVRKWGARMSRRFILAGDPNQCIYSFLGASPRNFLRSEIPEENVHILPRSYRMSREVHQAAQWFLQLARDRAEFDFEPREARGAFERVPYNNDDRLWEMIDDAEAFAADGYSVMILAPTSYHVDGVKRMLRQRGTPFHNPYRRRRGDWNPLHSSTGVSAASRLAAFLEPVEGKFGPAWTAYQVKLWSELLKIRGIMLHGKGKRFLNSLEDDHVMSYMDMGQVFHAPTVMELMPEAVAAPRLDWLDGKVKGQRASTLEFPKAVAGLHGVRALTDEPKITIGTIHSVKGGEADVVIVIPDMSPSGYEEWRDASTRDPVVRMFYVAISRAREAALIASPSTGYFAPPLVGR